MQSSLYQCELSSEVKTQKSLSSFDERDKPEVIVDYVVVAQVQIDLSRPM